MLSLPFAPTLRAVLDRRFCSAKPLSRYALAIAFAVAIAGLPAWPQGSQSSKLQLPETHAAPEQFTTTCTLCHGDDSRGTDRAPSLVNSAKLRGLSDREISDIIGKGNDKMPGFPLPTVEMDALVRYLRSLSPVRSETVAAGDRTAGERIFFGGGQCSTCHMVEAEEVGAGPIFPTWDRD